MTVLIGNNTSFISGNPLATSGGYIVPILTTCGPAIKVDFGPNGARATSNLFNRSGNKLGDLIDNGYDIPKNDLVTVEHSGDLSTLVVHENSTGDEVFYIHFLNPTEMKIRGIFACPSTNTIITINDEAMQYRGNKSSRVCMGDMGVAGIVIR
ncbi:MAG TPA: hypothetical protein VFQ82_11690 [Stellaceae bacterium]|jgi:hypothetical protein|nr:hypothetical protein [Stellaceae bacterium]